MSSGKSTTFGSLASSVSFSGFRIVAITATRGSEQLGRGSSESGGAASDEDRLAPLIAHSVIPPSTGSTAPVTYEAASEHSHVAAAATSSDLAMRPIGVCFS